MLTKLQLNYSVQVKCFLFIKPSANTKTHVYTRVGQVKFIRMMSPLVTSGRDGLTVTWEWAFLRPPHRHPSALPGIWLQVKTSPCLLKQEWGNPEELKVVEACAIP